MSNANTDLLTSIHLVGGDPLDMPFWEGTAKGQFLVHRCNECGRAYWPASLCTDHGGQAMQWTQASGRGLVHTFTILHHAYTPDMKGKTPYVVAVVQLEEGPFFHSSIIGCEVGDVHIGMAVEATMEAHPGGLTLPRFKPQPDS